MVPTAHQIAYSIGFTGGVEEFLNLLKRLPVEQIGNIDQVIKSEQQKGNKMDHGQTELSRAQQCACGNCNTPRHDSGKINMDHSVLKMLAGVPAGGNTEYRPFSGVKPTQVTEETLLEKGKSIMSESKLKHPSPEGFLEFMHSILANVGEDKLLELMLSTRPSQVQVEQQISDARDHQVEPFSEDVAKAADPEYLRGFFTKVVIPDFTSKLAKAPMEFEGQDLIREQRRLVARLQKLMQYQAKPESIKPSAIHDVWELAIYKCLIATKVVAGQFTEEVGRMCIAEAHESYHVRATAVSVNKKKQEQANEEARRSEVTARAMDELVRNAAKEPIGRAVEKINAIAAAHVGKDKDHPEVKALFNVLIDSLAVRLVNPLAGGMVTQENARQLDNIIPVSMQQNLARAQYVS